MGGMFHHEHFLGDPYVEGVNVLIQPRFTGGLCIWSNLLHISHKASSL